MKHLLTILIHTYLRFIFSAKLLISSLPQSKNKKIAMIITGIIAKNTSPTHSLSKRMNCTRRYSIDTKANVIKSFCGKDSFLLSPLAQVLQLHQHFLRNFIILISLINLFFCIQNSFYHFCRIRQMSFSIIIIIWITH